MDFHYKIVIAFHKRMKEQGVTYGLLARYLNISYDAAYNLVNNKRKRHSFTLNTYIRICNALKLDPGKVLNEVLNNNICK